VPYEVPMPGWTPPERYAPETQPFTKARIEYAATPTGSRSVIESAFTLSPAYTDPASPPTYDFTTDNAPAPAGWFWVVWIDAALREQDAGPAELRAASHWAPTTADVASRMRTMLRELGGGLAASFTDQTAPSASQVQMMIANDWPLVQVRLGSLEADKLTCPTAGDVRAAARAIGAERVALQVLETYLIDEIGGPINLEQRWERVIAEMEAVEAAAVECRAGEVVPGGVEPGEDGAAAGVAPAPRWTFPPAHRFGRW
jgi:hypothetical protein